MKTLYKYFDVFFPFVLCLFIGCSLIPTEKQQSQSVHSTEAISASHDRTIERALEVVPEYGLKVSSNGQIDSRNLRSDSQNVAIVPLAPSVRETLRVQESSGQNAGSHDFAKGTSASTIPFGVKLILAGVGIFIVVAALLYAWKSVKTTAVGQGISLGDAILSNQISKLRSRASVATDPAIAAQHLADVADLESQRGKLAQNK
jgi:hypothetical protein